MQWQQQVDRNVKHTYCSTSGDYARYYALEKARHENLLTANTRDEPSPLASQSACTVIRALLGTNTHDLFKDQRPATRQAYITLVRCCRILTMQQ